MMAPGRRRRPRGARRGLFAEIRATLRDPFYRHEVKRARRHNRVGLLLGVLMVLLSHVCCLGWVTIVAIPGVLVAEGLLYEFDRNTLDSLLLTSTARRRILWAKLLARLRPMLWVCLLCPLITALWVWLRIYSGGMTEDPIAAAGWAAGAGLVAGIFLLGQSFTSGAFGVLFVLQSRTRLTTYLLLLAAALAASVVVGVVGVVVMVVLGFTMMTAALGQEGPSGGAIAALVLLVIALAGGWIALVNVFLPMRIMAYSARRMDHLLLRGR